MNDCICKRFQRLYRVRCRISAVQRLSCTLATSIRMHDIRYSQFGRPTFSAVVVGRKQYCGVLVTPKLERIELILARCRPIVIVIVITSYSSFVHFD